MSDVNGVADRSAEATSPGTRVRRALNGAPGRRPWRALAYALLAGLIGIVALVAAVRGDPLDRAWRAAAASESYRLHGTTLTRSGGVTAAYSVTGVGAPSGALELALRPIDAAAAPPTELRIDWPSVTDAAGRAIAARTVGPLLPAGDPLLFLATGHGARRGPLETIAGRACRRVDFLVAARAYAAFWERRRSWLPINGSGSGLWRWEGAGSLWLDPATDRPCRIRVRVELPRLVGDAPGEGEADWVYADWRE